MNLVKSGENEEPSSFLSLFKVVRDPVFQRDGDWIGKDKWMYFGVINSFPPCPLQYLQVIITSTPCKKRKVKTEEERKKGRHFVFPHSG